MRQIKIFWGVLLGMAVILSGAMKVNAQEKYYPLVDTNKIWSMQHTTIANPNTTYSYYIKLSKDTTIKEITYKKVMRADDSLHLKWVRIGYIRETDDKKIFYLSKANNTEKYLYDFNIKNGDMIVGGKYIVNKIDSILIENHYRKRFYIDGGVNPEIWIEGIGSICGLLNVGMCGWSGGENSLICYTETDTIPNKKYINPVFGYCNYQQTVGETEFNVQSSKFKVKCFPNPAGEITNIKYQIPNKSNVELKVYDMLGNEVATLVDEEKEKGDYEIKFNTENLKNGIYFYKLLSGKNYALGKLIVMK